MRQLTLMTILIATACGLTACNTVRGIGQDIQKGGAALENAAKK